MNFTNRSDIFAAYSRDIKQQDFDVGGVKMHP